MAERQEAAEVMIKMAEALTLTTNKPPTSNEKGDDPNKDKGNRNDGDEEHTKTNENSASITRTGDDDDDTESEGESTLGRKTRLTSQPLIQCEFFGGKVMTFRFIDVPPDGHCMFHAMNKALGLKISQYELRKQMINFALTGMINGRAYSKATALRQFIAKFNKTTVAKWATWRILLLLLKGIEKGWCLIVFCMDMMLHYEKQQIPLEQCHNGIFPKLRSF